MGVLTDRLGISFGDPFGGYERDRDMIKRMLYLVNFLRSQWLPRDHGHSLLRHATSGFNLLDEESYTFVDSQILSPRCNI